MSPDQTAPKTSACIQCMQATYHCNNVIYILGQCQLHVLKWTQENFYHGSKHYGPDQTAPKRSACIQCMQATYHCNNVIYILGQCQLHVLKWTQENFYHGSKHYGPDQTAPKTSACIQCMQPTYDKL